MNKLVIGLGAANVDIHGRSRQSVIMRDSNPGHLTVAAGGVTRNILENAARLGCSSTLLTALGDDPLTGVIEKACAAGGVDLSEAMRVSGQPSSSYISVLDTDGDMLVAVSDMQVIKNLTPQWLDSKKELVQRAAVAVVDGCVDPALMEHFLQDTAKGIPVFGDTVSTAYALTIKQFLPYFHTVKPNRLELGILADMPVDTEEQVKAACDAVLEKGTFRVAVSMGSDGCYIASRDGDCVRVKHRAVEQVVNAGGGGDAFMGALISAFVRGYNNETAADWGLAAGALAVSAETTINPDMSESNILKTVKERKV